MYKKITLFLISLFLIFTITSCNRKDDIKATFVLNNGEENIINNVIDNYIIYPSIPSKENHIFKYWCVDEELQKPFNFETKVEKDTILYAKYMPDYKTLTNKITKNIIKSFVNIETINDINTSDIIAGSGIIIEKNNNIYYVLTNNHVCFNSSKYSIALSNYLDETYEAELIYSDPNYDLALLSFECKTQLEKIIFADANPTINEEIVCIGNPNGQRNAIIYGLIKEYCTIPSSNFDTSKTNVNFETISHTANLDSGASGGPLLDMNLNLVGINFASGKSNNQIISNHAIPIEKINEFLKSNNL